MIILGLFVVLGSVVLGAALVVENTGPAELVAFGQTVPGINADWQIFLAGVVVAVALMAGLTITSFGMGRAVRLRRELRDLREVHEESIQTLELEKRQLQRQLAQARNPTTNRTPQNPLTQPTS